MWSWVDGDGGPRIGMEEKIEVWNIFHDGSIVEAKGFLPSISLRIEIPYLRTMFPGQGTSFWAHLSGCTHFTYSAWDRVTPLENPSAIARQEPEILDVAQMGNMAHIVCVDGDLELVYESIRFEIDSGAEITIDELDRECRGYWKNWRERH